jgi:hypothetical protein
VAYQQALLNSSAFKYFQTAEFLDLIFELREGARDPLARHACLISWVPLDQNQQFYSRNINPVDARKTRYLWGPSGSNFKCTRSLLQTQVVVIADNTGPYLACTAIK